MQYCEDPNCTQCDGPPGSDKRRLRDAHANRLMANKELEDKKLPKQPKSGLPVNRLRNHPCPCGSGRKFKKCCLIRVQAKARAGQDMFPHVIVDPKTQEQARSK